jgi:hypothetical protein
MKLAVLPVLFLLPLGISHAQAVTGVSRVPLETEYAEVGSRLVEPQALPVDPVLPDAPVPKTVTAPCPAGPGRPCAFLSGRPYIRDRFRMSEHDSSWGRAVSNPVILGGFALETAAFVMDYKTTRYCLDHRGGKEGDPIYGQSRAQQLGVGVSLLSLSFFAMGKLKEIGAGNKVVLVQTAVVLSHGLAAYVNAENCGY